jgi:tubulin-specific chaperone A
VLEDKNVSVETAHAQLKLAQDDLTRKADDLEQASKYKSEFLANMSHELRSPLNSILIFSDLLAKNGRGSLSAKEVEFAKSVHSSGTDLLRLIEDILDLSKVEAGRLDIVAERFDLREQTDALRETFRPQAEGKGLAFEIEVEAGVPGVWATDRHRLGQILRNFVSNAVKFTDRGNVTLRIAKAAAVAPGSGVDPALAVELAVTDTGIGIKKEDQGKLFVAFQQIDAGANRRFAGTGLGLSISQKLAACLGGYVSMDSTPGRGSTFRVVVPYELGAPDMRPSAADLPRDLPPPLTALPPIPDDRHDVGVDDRILLIVEDDGDFARYLVDNGRSRGFKCIVARTGEDGVKDALAFRPSGIILDMKLPGMSGLSVLDRLRSEPSTKRTPVHVISAYEYHIEASKYENVSYLRKPITHDQLQTVIDQIGGGGGSPKRKILVVGRAGKERDDVAQAIAKVPARHAFAETGAAAVALVRDDAFDCIVMDVQLQQESAVQVLRELKATAGGERTPIIILSDTQLAPAVKADVERLASSVIVRGEKAKDRLLDEVCLFLHKVEAEAPAAAPRDPSVYDASFHGRKVLLVDDDMRNLFAIMTILEAQGMVIQTATNGREALAQLEATPDFDLVLMDMMMPEVDGYEATRIIRKDARFERLPVIALTARAMKGEREECLAAGASDYLSKPLSVDQLLALIKVWLA